MRRGISKACAATVGVRGGGEGNQNIDMPILQAEGRLSIQALACLVACTKYVREAILNQPRQAHEHFGDRRPAAELLLFPGGSQIQPVAG